MFLERTLRHYGFSMTELMVAMGLLGGISLVGMRLAQDNASNDSYVRFKAEVSKATAIIQTHLSDKNSCKTMLVGKTRGAYGSGVTMTQLTMTTNRSPAPNVTVVLLRDNQEYDGFKIPTGGLKLETSRMESGTNTVTDVVLTFEILGRSFLSRAASQRETIVKRIPVKTEINAGPQTIRSCGPVLADANADAKKQFCDSLGAKVAVWNTGTQECNLVKFSCPYGEVPSQFTSLGSFICIPVQNQLNPDYLFDWSSDGCSGVGTSVRLVPGAGGKIKAECL